MQMYLKTKMRSFFFQFKFRPLLFLPGNDVPNATNAIAVIVSVRPTVQPNYK
jgi:hypothetical protein